MDLQNNKMLEPLEITTEIDDGGSIVGPNPFLIQPILKIMMSKMNFTDLKNSRLVSTQWDELCVQQMLELQKKKSKKGQNSVTIGENFNVEEFTEQAQHRGLFTKFHISFYQPYLTKIHENPDLNILNNFPVTYLILNFSNFKQIPGSLLGWISIYKMCCQVSKTLKKLQFEYLDVGFGSQGATYHLDQVEFPLLEKFWFEVKDLEVGNPPLWYCTILETILQNSPKLQSVRMWEFPYSEGTFEDFCENRGFQQISRFQCESIGHFYPFGCDSDYEDEGNDGANYLEKLNFKEIKIKEFDLNAGWLQRAFFKFIGTQAATLESLDIKFEVLHSYSNKKTQFPHLPQLKVCKFIFNQYNASRLRDFEEFLEPFDFEEKFPNCVKFEVNKFEKFQNLIQNGSTRLKYLNVYDLYEDILAEKIIQLFPEISLVRFLPTEGDSSYIRDPFFLIPKIYSKEITSLKDLEKMEFSSVKDIEILKIKIPADKFSIEERQELFNLLISTVRKLQSLKQLTISFDGSNFSDEAKELLELLSRDIRKEYKDLNVIISFTQ